MWARNCDARQQTDFYGLQALVFFEKMLYGDAFVNLPMIQHRKDPYYLRLQVIESLLIATPPKYQGRRRKGQRYYSRG